MSKISKYSIEKAIQVWCDPNCKDKVMDTVLATAFAKQLDKERRKLKRPVIVKKKVTMYVWD